MEKGRKWYPAVSYRIAGLGSHFITLPETGHCASLIFLPPSIHFWLTCSMSLQEGGEKKEEKKNLQLLAQVCFSIPSKSLEGKVLDFRAVLILVSQLACATSHQTNLAWPYVWQPCRLLSQRAPSSISWWLMEPGSWEPSWSGAPSPCIPRLQGMLEPPTRSGRKQSRWTLVQLWNIPNHRLFYLSEVTGGLLKEVTQTRRTNLLFEKTPGNPGTLVVTSSTCLRRICWVD